MSNKKIKCPECESENIELVEIKGSFSTYKCLDCQNIFEIRVFIQISLSKEEKDKIKTIAKEQHTNMSDFCRVAIFDYIRRLKHPEMFNQTSNISFNPLLLEQLTNNTKKIIELQELTLEKTRIIDEMNKTLNLLTKYSIKTGKEKQTIISLFKAHSTLNPKEIIEKTKLNKEIVFAVITELREEDLIELTSRGRFKWK